VGARSAAGLLQGTIDCVELTFGYADFSIDRVELTFGYADFSIDCVELTFGYADFSIDCVELTFQIVACMEAVQKSRRDDTLLTVCFSLRTNGNSMRSPAGTTLDSGELRVESAEWRPLTITLNSQLFTLNSQLKSVVPAGLGGGGGYSVRKLKPTVNKVSSLRDFSIMRQFETSITRRLRSHSFPNEWEIAARFQRYKRFATTTSLGNEGERDRFQRYKRFATTPSLGNEGEREITRRLEKNPKDFLIRENSIKIKKNSCNSWIKKYVDKRKNMWIIIG
jgi:hypothetical protein